MNFLVDAARGHQRPVDVVVVIMDRHFGATQSQMMYLNSASRLYGEMSPVLLRMVFVAFSCKPLEHRTARRPKVKLTSLTSTICEKVAFPGWFVHDFITLY